MSARRILSDEQLDRMADMRERGRSYREIADWFTRNGSPISNKAIRWQCLRLGVFPPGPPPASIGVKTAGSMGRAFTPDEDRTLLSLESTGARPAEIARRLNRARSSVQGRLYTLARIEALQEAA